MIKMTFFCHSQFFWSALQKTENVETSVWVVIRTFLSLIWLLLSTFVRVVVIGKLGKLKLTSEFLSDVVFFLRKL